MKKEQFILVFLLLISVALAQKLPHIQEKSLRAPSNIKIDGKPDEWNNQFEAYNKAIEAYYTISNDKDKLYFTIQATDLDIANKIICAGITFTINGSGKMKDEGGIAVSFPILNKYDFPINVTPIDYRHQPVAMNQEFIHQATDMKITGIKTIKDTISIFNPEGIKVAALFNEEKVFTYELAIPLKQLGISVNDPKPVLYNIKLNGNISNPDHYINNKPGAEFNIKMSKELAEGMDRAQAVTHIRNYLRREIDERGGAFPVIDGKIVIRGEYAARIEALISPTDFSGEYTLVK